MIFQPAPGIVIIKPVEKETSSLTIIVKNYTRLLKGEVIAVGNDVTTDGCALLHMEEYAHIGDILYFLSYEGDYDNFIEENQKYYAVKVQDIRTKI